MSQKQTSSSGRVVREPNFETDLETLVERSLQQEHRDIKSLFYHNDALFSCYLNADNWPSHFVTDTKLALEPGKRTEMFYRDKKKPKNCIFLGRGPSKNVSEHQKATWERLKKGLPAQHVPPPTSWEQSSQKTKLPKSKPVLTASLQSIDPKGVPDCANTANKRPSPTLLYKDSTQAFDNQDNTPVPALDKTSATNCSAFKEFLKEHEKRMKRSREIASEIKKRGDKRRRKAVAEAEELVSLRFYFCVVRTIFSLM